LKALACFFMLFLPLIACHHIAAALWLLESLYYLLLVSLLFLAAVVSQVLCAVRMLGLKSFTPVNLGAGQWIGIYALYEPVKIYA